MDSVSTVSNAVLEMGEGAVVVADALGFRDAARSPEGVAGLVATISQTRDATSRDATLTNLGGEAHVSYAAVSDTIVMAAETRSVTRADAIAAVANSVVTMLSVAATTPLPLAYRGCLAAGPLFVAEKDLFVGKAIDEAAQWYERALSAIVWLTPSAADAIKDRRDDFGPLFVDCELSIRDLGTVPVVAVNPFFVVARDRLIRGPEAMHRDDCVPWLGRLLAPFQRSSALDVVLKRENTNRFLQRALDDGLTVYRRWARRKHDELRGR